MIDAVAHQRGTVRLRQRAGRREITGRFALGVVAVLRAALIYGEGADLSTRRLEWPRGIVERLAMTRSPHRRGAQGALRLAMTGKSDAGRRAATGARQGSSRSSAATR